MYIDMSDGSRKKITDINKQDKFATVMYGDNTYPEGTITGINFDFPWIKIVSGGGGVKDENGVYQEGATLFLGEVSCSINKPLEVGEPLFDECAATKGYVDTQIEEALSQSGGGSAVARESIILTDHTTGINYKVYMNNGSPVYEEVTE